MSKVQIIRDDAGRPAFAVIPYDDYRAAFGDPDGDVPLSDEEIFDAAVAALDPGEERIPGDVMRRMAAGEPALKVWREWRGLTQADFAAQLGVTANYISQIERGTGKRLSRKREQKAADILRIDIDLLRED